MSWVPWPVIWTEPARDTLRRIDRATAGRVVRAVGRYASSGHGNVIPLMGQAGHWRLRVGNWRVLFTQRQGNKPEERLLIVLAVRPRGGAYQD